ncbi:MAG: hypothetical protein RIT45_2092 [Pseudomonadota bacterium]|jgi:hypothetical protein
MKRRLLLTSLLSLTLASCAGPVAQVPVVSHPPTPAAPKEPAYIGRWARTIAACTLDQSHEDAPIEFHTEGYDHHETHCTFTKLAPDQAGRFEARLRCTVQGAPQQGVLTFLVEGDVLTLNPGRYGVVLVRCP